MSSKNFLFNMHPIESRVYISGEESYDCDPNLQFPWFTFGFRVIHSVRSVEIPPGNDDSIKIHDSFHEFYHQFDKLQAGTDVEPKEVVKSMLSDIQIPFPIDGKNHPDEDINCLHYWKDPYMSKTLTPLDGLDDVVMRILRRVLGAAVGGNRADLIITIEKNTILPHEEFEKLEDQVMPEHHHDSDDHDYDFDYRYRAIEDSLLNSLDRGGPRKYQQKGGLYAKSVQQATMIRRREKKLASLRRRP